MCVFIWNYYIATTDGDDAVVADDCGNDDDDDDIDSNNSNSHYQHTILEEKFQCRCRIWSKSPKQNWSTTTKTPPKTNHGTQENYLAGNDHISPKKMGFLSLMIFLLLPVGWDMWSFPGGYELGRCFSFSPPEATGTTQPGSGGDVVSALLSQINGWNLQPSPI